MMHAELVTIATGAAPFAEVDAAIPLALYSFGFAPLKAYLLAVFGNLIPLVPLLWFWGHGVEFLSGHSAHLKKLFDWVFARTRSRYGKRMETAGLTSLVVLLALPIPFAGAWTMTVLAYLFGFPFWKSFYAISLGVVLGAAVVLAIATGAGHFM